MYMHICVYKYTVYIYKYMLHTYIYKTYPKLQSLNYRLKFKVYVKAHWNS